MRVSKLAILLAALAAPASLPAQHAAHGAHHATSDSAFRSLQTRGARVMGVDQYTSSHRFESLRDGGRIVLQRDVDDSAGTAQIRAHLREVADRLARGDFSLSEQVHATEIPGARTLVAKRRAVRYAFRPLARGGEVRITSGDPAAVRAVHEFLAFQRRDHRSP